MELVPGESLRELLRRDGPMTWTDALPIVKDMLTGLQAAHAVNVLHRDIKPGNIMVNSEGAKLADFGIAKATDLTGLTGSSTMLGTPAYMAPDDEESVQSDLYAVGCVAFEMLTGAPPFEGSSMQSVLMKHTKTPIDLARVSPRARSFISALTEKERSRRPVSAVAALSLLPGETLVPVPQGPRVPSPNLPPALEDGSAMEVVSPRSPAPEDTSSRLRRRKWPLVLVASGLVAAFAIFALALVLPHGGDQRTFESDRVLRLVPNESTYVLYGNRDWEMWQDDDDNALVARAMRRLQIPTQRVVQFVSGINVNAFAVIETDILGEDLLRQIQGLCNPSQQAGSYICESSERIEITVDKSILLVQDRTLARVVTYKWGFWPSDDSEQEIIAWLRSGEDVEVIAVISDPNECDAFWTVPLPSCSRIGLSSNENELRFVLQLTNKSDLKHIDEGVMQPIEFYDNFDGEVKFHKSGTMAFWTFIPKPQD